MEGFKIGEIVKTVNGYEKIVAIEWGNPVTIAVDAMKSVVSAAPHPASVEAERLRTDSPSDSDLRRFGSPAVSQLIKI